jgi:hypothetical protein
MCVCACVCVPACVHIFTVPLNIGLSFAYM